MSRTIISMPVQSTYSANQRRRSSLAASGADPFRCCCCLGAHTSPPVARGKANSRCYTEVCSPETQLLCDLHEVRFNIVGPQARNGSCEPPHSPPLPFPPCASTRSSSATSRASRSSSSRTRPTRAATQLFETVEVLSKLDPSFFSVTYGAGGSTHDRRRTLEITKAIRDEHGVEAMAHLNCVGETAEGLRTVVDEIASLGNRERARPARRSPRRASPDFVQPEGGLGSAAELAEMIARPRRTSSRSAAPASPRSTPRPTTSEKDLDYLKTKVDAGATFLITQLFFDNQVYFDFVARRPGRRDRRPDHPRHRPDRQPRPGEAHLRALRRDDPEAARGRARPRSVATSAPSTSSASPTAPSSAPSLLRPRRARNPLLRAQPLAGDQGDPRRPPRRAPLGLSAQRAARGARRVALPALAAVPAQGRAGSPTGSTGPATARSS